jgi:hypothetical protein
MHCRVEKSGWSFRPKYFVEKGSLTCWSGFPAFCFTLFTVDAGRHVIHGMANLVALPLTRVVRARQLPDQIMGTGTRLSQAVTR